MIKENITYLLSKGLSGIISLMALSVISYNWPDNIYGKYSIIIANSNIIIVLFFYCIRIYYTRFSKRNNFPINFRQIDSIINSISLLALIIGVSLTKIDSTIALSILIAFTQIKFELLQEKQRIEFKAAQYLKSAVLKSFVYITSILTFSYIEVKSEYGLVASYIISFLVIILINKGSFSMLLSKDYRLLKKAVVFGFPFMFTPISSTILYSYYRYCIQGSLGSDKLGGFSYVNDLCEYTIIAAMMAVNLSGYPKLIKYFENKDWYNFFKQSEFNLALQCNIYLAVIAVSTLVLPIVLGTIVSSNYTVYMKEIFFLLILGSFIKGLKIYYLDHFLLVLEDKKTNIISTVVYLLASIVLLPVLINKYGIIGAAYNFIILNALYLIITAYMINSKYHLIPFKPIAVLSIGLIITNAIFLDNNMTITVILITYYSISIFRATKNENSNILARFK